MQPWNCNFSPILCIGMCRGMEYFLINLNGKENRVVVMQLPCVRLAGSAIFGSWIASGGTSALKQGITNLHFYTE